MMIENNIENKKKRLADIKLKDMTLFHLLIVLITIAYLVMCVCAFIFEKTEFFLGISGLLVLYFLYWLAKRFFILMKKLIIPKAKVQ
jgi:hypothetical protein